MLRKIVPPTQSTRNLLMSIAQQRTQFRVGFQSPKILSDLSTDRENEMSNNAILEERKARLGTGPRSHNLESLDDSRPTQLQRRSQYTVLAWLPQAVRTRNLMKGFRDAERRRNRLLPRI
jgi:hypothetical protein